jgi:hypothetical protein
MATKKLYSMMNREARLIFAILAVFVAAGIGASAAREGGPVYSMEGAWYGMVSIRGLGSTPAIDTFSSNALREGYEGTFLCTIPAVNKMPNPLNPNGWLAITPTGHGNWVRIGKNLYAFTAVRAIFDEAGMPFGWGRFWGTVSPISQNELTGTMNAQYYLLDGRAMFPQPFTGTMHRRRVEITYEQITDEQ